METLVVNLNSSSGLDLVLAFEPRLAEDGTAEIMIPTYVVPTDGANLRGSASANPMVRDLGLVIGSIGWTISSSANRRIRSCLIY